MENMGPENPEKVLYGAKATEAAHVDSKRN